MGDTPPFLSLDGIITQLYFLSFIYQKLIRIVHQLENVETKRKNRHIFGILNVGLNNEFYSIALPTEFYDLPK
jgi:hypothetical protein